MARDQILVGPLGHLGHLEFHAVALRVTLNLAMAKHRQSGHGAHHRGHAETLVAAAKLINRRALVGVGHEVHIALQDVRVELNRLLQIAAILGVFFVAQHVHKRGVIHAMHAQRAYEVALQHPEGLRQQQRARHLNGNTVHHLTPELRRHNRVELLIRHRIFSTRRDGPAHTRQREPQPLHMALGQHHGGVKTDDGEHARYVQDGLHHLLAHVGLRVVQLRGVVPGKGRAVVAVIDVTCLARAVVADAKCYRGVGLIVIVIIDLDLGA